jgi:hypothetical protein
MRPNSPPVANISRRRLRIAIAGTIFGAAIGGSLMYSPWFFEAECNIFLGDVGWHSWDLVPEEQKPFAREIYTIRAFGRHVHDGPVPLNTGRALVRLWQLRVIAVLGLVGGFLGASVGSLRFWVSGPPPELKLWHYIFGFATVFMVLVLFGLPHSKHSLFVRFTDRQLSPPSFATVISRGEAVREAVGLAVLSVVIGWAGTTVIVAWGRLRCLWAPPDEAADYDDRASPSPPVIR